MSILIDELVQEKKNMEKVGGSLYIKKPSIKNKIKDRLKDAINVLSGNAQSFHYFEDEANTWGEVK